MSLLCVFFARHLKEHLKDMTGDKLDTSKMTPRERTMHMFLFIMISAAIILPPSTKQNQFEN
jgi:hypothetical protein